MRVYFTNLGCKLNQAENDSLARDFLAAGHQLAPSLAEADLHVVNSCTVTAAAARSSRQAARAAARAASTHAHAPRTVLTGCYATASPAEAAGLPGIDLVVANRDKERLLEHVHRAFGGAATPEPSAPASKATAPKPEPSAPTPEAIAPTPEPFAPKPEPSAPTPEPSAPPAAGQPHGPHAGRLPYGNTRALIKVEDGCDMRCAFCIIPATRGRQRSRPLAALVEEVRRLVLAGHREVVVTGVQISAWRAPRAPGEAGRRDLRLADLVRALLAVLPPAAGTPAPPSPAANAPAPPLPAPPAPASPATAARLRLTSIAPWELDDELLALWADRRLCRHLHLSLQSGAGATLRRMRRPYTPATYARLVERVRAAIPGVAVTTDVIVGFPGETAAEHEESLATVAALGFAKVHVFPYSPRPGTAAATLPGAVPPPEQRRRMAGMLAAAAQAERDFHAAHLGRRETVLWERPRDGRGQGLTDNYIRVFSPAGAGLWNRLGEVELLSLAPGGMLGRVL